jgi:hypothetical protein
MIGDWEQNILEARYFSVNRLASKCIQRHGLTTVTPTEAAGFIFMMPVHRPKFAKVGV